VAVTDVHGEAADFLGEVHAEPRVVRHVGVSKDRLDRGDLRQDVEHLPAADIARVKDDVYAFKGEKHLGQNQAVRVGDQADDAAGRHH